MGVIGAADTVFDHPLYTTWPTATQSGDTAVGGRLMSSSPHTDGLIFVPAGQLQSNSANLVLTRNAKGDWSLNRTAAAAETYYVRGVPTGIVVRTGEHYYLDLFPETNSIGGPAVPAPKGIEITDVFACFNVGVALPTTLTLRVGSSQYPAEAATLGNTGAALVVTDLLAATSILPTALTTASDYVTQAVAIATPGFVVTDITQLELELEAVLANTGTIQLAALGCHCNFLFN